MDNVIEFIFACFVVVPLIFVIVGLFCRGAHITDDSREPIERDATWWN